jgi:hypothetical protein
VGRTIFLQDPDHVLSPVGGGKHPSSPLFHRGQASFLEEGKKVMVEEAGEDVVEEFSVVAVAFDEGREVAAVGQVAPSLAGEGQLDAHPAHLFQEKDPGPQFGRPSGSHQPRGPPSDDNNIWVKIQRLSPQRHRVHRETSSYKKSKNILVFQNIYYIQILCTTVLQSL